MTVAVTGHFVQRVQERLPGVDPFQFAEASAWAITAQDDQIAYAGRSIRAGNVFRKFDFDFRNERHRLVVSDAEPGHMTFITVMKVTARDEG